MNETKPKRPRKVWTKYSPNSKAMHAFCLLTLTSLLLAGCATSKESLFPQGGKTMKNIYEQQMAESHSDDIDAARANVIDNKPVSFNMATENTSPINQSIDKVDQTFPQIPNPTLAMYVFPHLAGVDEAPVPGYVTAFPLYTQVYYALPGEVAIQ